MKRTLSLLLASLLVVIGLTACGGSDKKPDNGGSGTVMDGGNAGTNGSSSQENRPNSSTGHEARPEDKCNSPMEDAEQGVEKAVRGAEDLVNDATRGAEDLVDGATRGARVHDRNGDLTDLENGVARNSTR